MIIENDDLGLQDDVAVNAQYVPNKKSNWDEVFIYALDKYKGNEDKALKFCRGWFSCGEALRLSKEKKD